MIDVGCVFSLILTVSITAWEVQFVELIDAAETRLRALLVSRTPTDVTEAISVEFTYP